MTYVGESLPRELPGSWLSPDQTSTTHHAYKGDAERPCGEHSRTISKTLNGDTTHYVLDLAACGSLCGAARTTTKKAGPPY
jgi:hypothetical protein